MENEQTLEEQLAAKDATIAEMKAAADAQHAEFEKMAALVEESAIAGKVAAEALEAKTAELEQAKADFANQLAERDAKIAEQDKQFAEARSRWEADTLAANKTAADARAEADKAHAAALAEKDAEITALKAAQKSAEQIAAEKYGAGILAGNVPAPSIDTEALRANYEAVKNDPIARVKFIRELSPEAYAILFH